METIPFTVLTVSSDVRNLDTSIFLVTVHHVNNTELTCELLLPRLMHRYEEGLNPASLVSPIKSALNAGSTRPVLTLVSR